ncbi:MAG TPA: VOC family protein [Candidatus Kapabacteria bacterium]|jgi:catechol 2,3-dioxygenase-like lactoylglutathione lyase family enzyme
MPRIGHIILNVSNFEQSELFYDRLLLPIGFHIDHREQDELGAAKSYRSGEHNFWIRWDSAIPHNDFVRDIGLDHLAFFVDTKEAVDTVFAERKAMGAHISREPKGYPEYSATYYAFYFRDPDGILLEIAFE